MDRKHEQKAPGKDNQRKEAPERQRDGQNPQSGIENDPTFSPDRDHQGRRDEDRSRQSPPERR